MSVAGLSYQRLVPATVLPPEDPSRRPTVRRTVRDWVVDAVLFVLSTGFGILFVASNTEEHSGSTPPLPVALDIVLGLVACGLLWLRRRWPTGVALATAALSVVSLTAAPASVVGLFTVAVHRRSSAALFVTAVNLVAAAGASLLSGGNSSFLFDMGVSAAVVALVVAWGMFVRARRQLVWTLRERAERAEADQRRHAEQARSAERSRIAREMHDVLGHRISLLALHAGGLQVRPDLAPEQVRQTAALLRDTAQQALDELRGVIGVLRGPGGDGVDAAAEGAADGTLDSALGGAVDRDAGAPAAPQPTLPDIARLVDDTRRAGAKVDLRFDVADAASAPGALGRDAYRIVQEGLTNVAKHAHDTATTVVVDGGPGAGLRVTVRNRLPLPGAGTPSGPGMLPGSGTGLLGLRERVALAGGTIEHGAVGGDFVVSAEFAW